MPTASDFIRIPFTPELTQAGITCALRSQKLFINHESQSPYDLLQQSIFQASAELALRRYLVAEKIPHNSIDIHPLSKPEKYEISIGGRYCSIQVYPLIHKKSIRRLIHAPEEWLSLPVFIPRKELIREPISHYDLLIFAFTIALTARKGSLLLNVLKSNRPVYLASVLPSHWSQPKRWTSMGELEVKSNSSQSVELELGGYNCEKCFHTEQLTLPPKQRISTKDVFHALTYLHPDLVPDGQIGIYSPRLDVTWLVSPINWVNVWVYGMEIVLTGYLPRSEFIHCAHPLAGGTQILPNLVTPVNALGVNVSSLLPLYDLFDQAKKWKLRSLG